MSIVKIFVGRHARDHFSPEARRRPPSLVGLPARFSWHQFYTLVFALLIVALCYKLMVLWTATLLCLGTAAWVARTHLHKINAAFVVSLLYVADATITAFFVSSQAGLYRSAQFLVIAASLIGIFAYSFKLQTSDSVKLLKSLSALSALIFLHMIVYHIIEGRYITWKYLYDTKVVISLSVFLVFTMKDEIEKRISFAVVIFFLGSLVIMSAERKALLLLVVLLFASGIRLWKKLALIASAGLLVISIAVTGVDGGYLDQKFQASSANYGEVSERYFATVHNIDDYSDLIRDFTNRKAMQLYHEHPWFGVGATGYAHWANATFGRGSGLAMNVHGEVHRIPAEGGIVGLFIVGAYMLIIGWRVSHFAFLRVGRSGNSLERAPLYLLLYVLCYAYGEAIDSTMLVLIGLSGVVAARLPRPELSVLVKRRRSSADGSEAPRARRRARSDPQLVRRLVGRGKSTLSTS